MNEFICDPELTNSNIVNGLPYTDVHVFFIATYNILWY